MKNINSPSHYTSGKIEVIDFIEDQQLGFGLGNAIKYISRAGKKDSTKTEEDLRKAIWYIERFIQNLEPVKEEIQNNLIALDCGSDLDDMDAYFNTRQHGEVIRRVKNEAK